MLMQQKNGDLDFLRQMIKHHQMALEMASKINQTTQWDYVKNLSYKIYTGQKAEIDEMKRKAFERTGVRI